MNLKLSQSFYVSRRLSNNIFSNFIINLFVILIDLNIENEFRWKLLNFEIAISHISQKFCDPHQKQLTVARNLVNCSERAKSAH